MGRPDIAAVPTAGAKGEKGTVWFPFPSCLRRQTAANRCIGGDKPFAEGKREKDAHPCSR